MTKRLIENMTISQKRKQKLYHGKTMCGSNRTLSYKTNNQILRLWCVIIDPATGWFEMKELKNKEAITVANLGNKLG